MIKERNITINIIENKKIYNRLLIEYFAKKYSDKYIEKNNLKS